MIYRLLSMFNDMKAVKKGRIGQRAWNKIILKLSRRLMK